MAEPTDRELGSLGQKIVDPKPQRLGPLLRIARGSTRPLDVPLEHDLRNAGKVELRMRRQGGGDLIGGICDILDVAAGLVRYQWADGQTAVAGLYYVEWLITFRDGTDDIVPFRGRQALEVRNTL